MMVQRRLLGLVRAAPIPVGLTVACALAAMLAGVGQWFFTADVVRKVFTGAAADDLVAPLVTSGLLLLARAALLWLRDLAGTWTATIVKRRLRGQLLDKLLALGPAFSVRHRTGDVAASVADGVEALKSYVGFYLPQAAVSLAGPVVLVIALLFLDPVVGLVVGICVLGLPLARTIWNKLLRVRGRAHWEAYEDFAAGMLDALYGMTTLRTLGASRRYGDRMRADAASLYRATVSDLAASLGVVSLTALLVGTGTVLSVGVGALRVASGDLDPGALLLILFLAGECFRPQAELANYWHDGFYGLAASHGIFALLDEPEPLTEPSAPADQPTRYDVALDTVTYTYPAPEGTARARPALTKVSLTVPAGGTVALVGRSGAGKSTITGLLQRFFDPDSGSVQIGGTDLRRLSLVTARSLTAVVSQDVHLFAESVAANLRFAKPGATDAEVVQAAQRARIHEVIQALPEGYDTVLGERGASLSGGERQRLAIARALLADAPILILDEATSSVDGANERALHDAMDEARRGRTTLIIAHRMATVAGADQIVVLDEGRVVEAGDPAELLRRRDGRYAQLVAAAREI